MAIAAAAALAGGALALHHPLFPAAAFVLLLAWCGVAAWRPGLWLFVLPAALPVLSFAPWSGWTVFDEFDLAVLGATAGGYLRLAMRLPERGGPDGERWPRAVSVAVVLFVAANVCALIRGLMDAGAFAFGPFQSYVEPMNSVRLFKPLLFVLLLAPLMQVDLARSRERAAQRVGAGMWVGLVVASLAVLWERVAMPGLTDFSKPYRAVGLFWEMHVGGAAIDAYLAMAAPFAAWALWRARTPWRWTVAAAVALLVAYACLTTFSRGVYAAVAAPLLVLGAAAARWTSPLRWHRRAGRALVGLLALEIVAVISTGSFLIDRMARSDRDLRERIEHWAAGVRLMHDPSDIALGIGLGRLPSHLSRFVEGDEFPGSVTPAPKADQRNGVRVGGPATRVDLAGLYSLTQRVPLHEGARYRVEFDYRVDARTPLIVRVCELHLLYERSCQSAALLVAPGLDPSQHASALLSGPSLRAGHWFAPRMAVFEVAVLGAASHVDLTRVQLLAGTGDNLLRNGDFSESMAHWFPSARSWFVPWHIDNLYLEILIERGPAALVGFMVAAAWTLRRSVIDAMRGSPVSPFLAASIGGALLVGCVSSVMDAPRPAFLLLFLLTFSALLHRAR